MKSSNLQIDARRRSYVRLIGEIHHALNQALAEEFERRQLTQAEMARILECTKSFVSRKMNGGTNMTLETLADLAFALDRPVKVQLPARHHVVNSNHVPATARSTGSIKHLQTPEFATSTSGGF